MPQSDIDHLWVSWDEYHRAIESLVLVVHRSGWHFDHVLCLARGGMRPGDVFSRVFNVPLSILSASSYRDNAGTVQGNLDIARHITGTGGNLSGRVLIVDDLADSGVTLAGVTADIARHSAAISEVRTAVIWCKACSVIKPDYYVHYLESSPWIHQPFEMYDGLTPEELANMVSAPE